METEKKTRIGVLALQGAFQLHQRHLESLGADYVPVVATKDFADIDGLILPGGESGVMLKLIDAVGVRDAIAKFLIQKPVWGICAGAILIAKQVHNPAQSSFAALDIEIERNAYGRQLDSVYATIDDYVVSFIRAPRISRVGQGVRVLNKKDGYPTWIETHSMMATTFHPETNLNVPSPWHRRFFEICQKS